VAVGGEIDLVAEPICNGAVLGREVGLRLVFVGVAANNPTCPLLLWVRLQVNMLQQSLHLHMHRIITLQI